MQSEREVETGIEAAALLSEPVRRALYRYVVAQPAAVGRDEAARAAGVSRGLAAFHLDRLVAGGLLEPVYRRLSGRSGPGAGRPSKLYRPSGREIEISVPRRQYRLAAHIFARALALDDPRHARESLRRAAHELGVGAGVDARRRAGARPSRARLRAAVVDLLAGCGFQPFEEGTGVTRLLNCPFQALAREHQHLVCEMGLALVEGMSTGAGARSLSPEADPTPGRCCVVLRARGGGSG